MPGFMCCGLQFCVAAALRAGYVIWSSRANCLSQRHYDASNTRSSLWSAYTDYFNAANPAQLTARSMVYDPGAFTHVTFGAVHQTQWEYTLAGDPSHGVARYYNASNVLLGQELF